MKGGRRGSVTRLQVNARPAVQDRKARKAQVQIAAACNLSVPSPHSPEHDPKSTFWTSSGLLPSRPRAPPGAFGPQGRGYECSVVGLDDVHSLVSSGDLRAQHQVGNEIFAATRLELVAQ